MTPSPSTDGINQVIGLAFGNDRDSNSNQRGSSPAYQFEYIDRNWIQLRFNRNETGDTGVWLEFNQVLNGAGHNIKVPLDIFNNSYSQSDSPSNADNNNEDLNTTDPDQNTQPDNNTIDNNGDPAQPDTNENDSSD